MILQPDIPSWQNRLIAFCQGRSTSWVGRRLALIGRKIVLRRLPVPVIANVEGLKVKLHLSDNICERRFLFMPQFFDVEERQLLTDTLPEDGVFIDIGANVGLYSLTASKKLTQAGKILAVEPNPVTHQRLVENFALNQIAATVHLERLGVGRGDGEIVLHLHPENLGQASANPDFDGQPITVPSKALLDLVERHGLGKIDALKIDIEGFEDQALLPFFEVAERMLFPRLIIIEKSEHQWREDLLGKLASCGYKLRKTTKNNHLFELI